MHKMNALKSRGYGNRTNLLMCIVVLFCLPAWSEPRIRVRGGDALVDGLSLASSPSILANGDFSQRDPISITKDSPSGGTRSLSIPRGWRRHYGSRDSAGEANGTFEVEQRGNENVLLVQKSEGEFVLSAAPLAAPAAVSYVARARIGSCPELPTIVVRQFGSKGLLKEARSKDVSSGGAAGPRTISTGPVTPAAKAERLFLLLRFPKKSGTYCVRSVELICQAKSDPRPAVRLDQIGYDADSPLRFIVESEVFPPKGTGSFSVRSPHNVYKGTLVPLGRTAGQGGADWGCYYFEGRVDNPKAGVYRLSVELNRRAATRADVIVAPRRHLTETAELAFRFYSVQRCGCAVPGWHGPCHMDDAKLPDGSHVDVSGGYHNAGDYHKHMDDNTPVSVYAMVTAYENNKEFFAALDRDGNSRSDLLDEAAWGADWMLKMIDPKTGHSWRNVTNDIDYWGIPERDTDNTVNSSDDRVVDTGNPGDFGAWNIAGWASLARHVPDARYLNAAERMWSTCEKDLIAGHNPRALIAAIELYRTTHEKRYKDSGDQLALSLLALQSPDGWFASGPGGGPQFRIVDEGTIPAALAMYVLTWPKSDHSRPVKESIRNYFRWGLHMAENPFGIIRHYAGGEYFYFKSRDEWFGGSNSAYCSTAWAARLASKVFEDDPDFGGRLREHADNQIHWVLGMNPMDLCMFEGKGNSSRIRYHHTYSTIPNRGRGAVPGAIPNGLTREPGNSDRPWFDFRPTPGGPPGAESAEPWLPHNAYYLLMLSAN
jgi:hypothetical protein